MNKMNSYKLSDLYKMSSGISTKPEQAGHGSPFISFNTVFHNFFLPDVLTDKMDITDAEKEIYSISAGDILLTRTSETLNELGISCVALKDYPGCSFSGFLKRLRPIKSGVAYPKYMGFYLRSSIFRKAMDNNAVMTLRASLNEQIFSYLHILLPSYSSQIKIGDFLYLINDKIKINNEINIRLQEISKTVYEYWFLQFDFPDNSGKPYRSSGGKMIWNDKVNREIPDGWQVTSLIDFCNIYQPKTISEKDFDVNGEYLVHGSNGIIGRYSKYNHENSEVVVSCRGDCGNVHRTLPKMWITGNAMVFQLKNNEINNEYLFHCLRYAGIKKISSGSVQGQITRTNVANIKVVLPPMDILMKYSNVSEKFVSKSILSKIENLKLVNLRNWLLPILVNGQAIVN